LPAVAAAIPGSEDVIRVGATIGIRRKHRFERAACGSLAFMAPAVYVMAEVVARRL
jgi:hypothetical protein